jgi:hypothetical protein
MDKNLAYLRDLRETLNSYFPQISQISADLLFFPFPEKKVSRYCNYCNSNQNK